MSTDSHDLIESALSLPQPQRADLALQLLQSLDQPGEEVSAEEFGQELRERVKEYRAGEVESHSLEEARAAIARRISEGQRS